MTDHEIIYRNGKKVKRFKCGWEVPVLENVKIPKPYPPGIKYEMTEEEKMRFGQQPGMTDEERGKLLDEWMEYCIEKIFGKDKPKTVEAP